MSARRCVLRHFRLPAWHGVATGLLHDASMKPEKSWRAIDAVALERAFRVNTIGPALIARHAPQALPILFGHIGEGNLHLNVLRCDDGQEAEIYAAMMELIAAHGGNVSSEHGVGTLKRNYLGMSRGAADIEVMRSVKAALDPTGYLNPAVLFD